MKTGFVSGWAIASLCLIGATRPIRADFAFGKPENLGSAINSSSGEYGPCPSADGLELYYFRGDAVTVIWVARRATPENAWEPASLLGPSINKYDSGTPFITPDRLMLFLDGNRPGSYGSYDLWMASRATVSDDWSAPINLGPTVNSSSEDWGAHLSADGLELYFTSNRPGGQGNLDLWMTTRDTVVDNWKPPVNLGQPVNTSAIEVFPSISADGRVLFFASGRAGTMGPLDLHMTRRATAHDPWDVPVNLGLKVNSGVIDNGPKVSADGSTLYFFSFRAGGLGGGDIWQVPIRPVVDFNADGTVGTEDLAMFIEGWGQTDSLYDIGPLPWGDGVVDAADLEVLMGHWGRQADDPTLLAHWPFDETTGLTVHDPAGANDGTIVGSAQWRPQDGKVGGALELDGITSITANSALNPADGPFSVLAWIKGGAPGQVMVSQQTGADWLMADPATGALMTELAKGGRMGSGLSSDALITDGNWHRIALTWDGAKRRLYADSVLVAEDSRSSMPACFGKIVLGAGKDMAAGASWSGLIDDVRTYNRAVKP